MSTSYGRKGSVVLVEGEKGLDLSTFKFVFRTQQADIESPSNCSIRIYNLSQDTVQKIKKEFSRVVLNAGYEGNFGVIFDGTIKQFGEGKENATDSYLDILAADGDKGYNFSTVSTTLAAGNTPDDRIKAALSAMEVNGVSAGYLMPFTGGVLPRGKVLFGMARNYFRQECQTQGASWSINNGQINIIPLDGYLPGEAVVLNAKTGMVGLPVQTIDGIRVTCLLNPKIVIGSLIQIDNKSINKTLQKDPEGPKVAFNSYAGLQFLADTTADGFYRVFVAEHHGDSRGNEWYTEIVALAVAADTKKVQAKE